MLCVENREKHEEENKVSPNLTTHVSPNSGDGSTIRIVSGSQDTSHNPDSETDRSHSRGPTR